MSAKTLMGRWGETLRCGPFVGERYGTTLRWLAAGGHECVRMIAAVVRDRAWRTLSPDARSVRRRLGDGGRWTVRARTPVGAATLVWRLEVAPRARGIEVSVAMVAERDVVTNRAGLVVLLPAATFAGARFVAEHRDGTVTRGSLPRAIAPHQPMLGLAGARIAAANGPALALGFEGETFEMEDQRNWLDPSFKLYSRALSRPVPYRIRDGARVEQRVRIDLVESGSTQLRARPRAPRRGRLPAVGIATAPGRVPSEVQIVAALREIEPAFVLHRTDAKGSDVPRARALAASLGASLRVEAFHGGDALVDALLRAGASSVAMYFSREGAVNALRERAPAAVTGGTFADFVMLNRTGVAPGAHRAIFALCPTVHASDDRSLVETLDTLPCVFAQARRLAAGRPVDAGPCALRRRLVPRNGRPADRPRSPLGVPYDVDARQGEPIAAAWLAVAIAVAGAEGIDSLCAFEAAGARGIIGAHEPFPTAPQAGYGRRTPAYAVLQALVGVRRAPVVLHGLRAADGAVFSLGGDRAELWLVELSGRARPLPRAVSALGPPFRLDPDAKGASWRAAKFDQPLGAYAIARIALARSSQRSVAAIARDWCGLHARATKPDYRGDPR